MSAFFNLHFLRFSWIIIYSRKVAIRYLFLECFTGVKFDKLVGKHNLNHRSALSKAHSGNKSICEYLYLALKGINEVTLSMCCEKYFHHNRGNTC